VKEPIPPNAPKPLGKPVVIHFYVDANHAGDQVTRRSRTGLIMFMDCAVINWYSKKQGSVEGATFGSECMAVKTVVSGSGSVHPFIDDCRPQKDLTANRSVIDSSTATSLNNRQILFLSHQHLPSSSFTAYFYFRFDLLFVSIIHQSITTSIYHYLVNLLSYHKYLLSSFITSLEAMSPRKTTSATSVQVSSQEPPNRTRLRLIGYSKLFPNCCDPYRRNAKHFQLVVTRTVATNKKTGSFPHE
jgi:hypothetical protein